LYRYHWLLHEVHPDNYCKKEKRHVVPIIFRIEYFLRVKFDNLHRMVLSFYVEEVDRMFVYANQDEFHRVYRYNLCMKYITFFSEKKQKSFLLNLQRRGWEKVLSDRR
jgi:hypothetical protein